MAIQDTKRPRVYVEISQPGDRGSFHIRVMDEMAQRVICENKLPENFSTTQYRYTARLLESRQAGLENGSDQANAASFKDSKRYEDIVRYGQKLYADIFGEKDQLKKYMRRAKHLQDGLQIVLRLHSTASELWNVPYEYMHDGENFLAVDKQAWIIRNPMDSRLDEEAADVRDVPLPLRILVVLSDPEGVAPLNIDQEVRNILNALKSAEEKGLVIVDFVEEGSMYNIEIMMADYEYHILHYSGHGGMSPEGSFLALEDQEGNVAPAFVRDLLPVIRKSKSLRMVVMNGCKTGQIDETQAMSGIATGLLQVVPAVAAMQFTIWDDSAQLFTKAFYESIGQGYTLEVAMHRARLAMNKSNPHLADWGIPALYTHRPNIRLVNPKQKTKGVERRNKFDTRALSVPTAFVGRRKEQRELRGILPYLDVSMAYIWGLGGVGKSALAGRIIERPGRPNLVQDALIITCDKVKPLEIFQQISDWLKPHFPEAAQIMVNSKLPPQDRVVQAAKLVKRKRLILVFDNFDFFLKETKDRQWEIPVALLAQFFYEIAVAEWSILTVFTSRYRWSFLYDLPEGSFVEVHLNTIGHYNLGFMLSQLPHLKKVNPKELGNFLNSVGGHPYTLRLINSTMSKHPSKNLLKDQRFKSFLAKSWEKTFLEDAFKRLNKTEYETLVSICIMDSSFWAQHVQLLAGVETKDEAELIMARWEALSFAHYLYTDNEGDPWYMIHGLIRTYVLDQQNPKQLKVLHKRAADMIERDWMMRSISRYAEDGKTPPESWSNFIVAVEELRYYLQNVPPAYSNHLISRAMTWRDHCLKSGSHDKAYEIIDVTWNQIAYRLNMPQLAKEMLEETLKQLKSDTRERAVIRSHLTQLMEDEGKTDEAMKEYDELGKVFAKLNDDGYLALMLSRQADLYWRKGKLKKAIDLQKKALKIRQHIKFDGGIATSLICLSNYTRDQEKYDDAMRYVRQAELVLRKIQDWKRLGSVLQTAGLLYKHLNNLESAFGCFRDAANIADQAGNWWDYAAAISEMGQIMLQVGQLDDAANLVLQAIDMAEQLGDKNGLTIRLHRLSLIYESQRNYREAVVMGERAMEVARQYAPQHRQMIQESLRRQRRKA